MDIHKLFICLSLIVLTFSCHDRDDEANPNSDFKIESVEPTVGPRGVRIQINISGLYVDKDQYGRIVDPPEFAINGHPIYDMGLQEYDGIVHAFYGAAQGSVGGDGPVTLTYKGKTAIGPDFHYTEEPAINIVSIHPTLGNPGTEVSIIATGLHIVEGLHYVYFNGVKAKILHITFRNGDAYPSTEAQTEIVAVVPANAGDGLITLKVDNREGIGPLFDYRD